MRQVKVQYKLVGREIIKIQTKVKLRVNVNQAFENENSSTCVRMNSSSSARVLTPLSLGGPDIVHVLPEPVCPYAKMHTL